MVVDTSAVLSILLDEADALQMAAAIQSSPSPVMSAASYVELAMVALSRQGTTVAEIDWRLAQWGVEVCAVTPGQARLAAEAFARYGKGRHPAALNFGDCFSYALATERGEALLFKGGDFGLTDIRAA